MLSIKRMNFPTRETITYLYLPYQIFFKKTTFFLRTIKKRVTAKNTATLYIAMISYSSELFIYFTQINRVRANISL